MRTATLGICRWCGAKVKKGHEEEHFAERADLRCTECKWHYTDIGEDGKTKGHYCRFRELARKNGIMFRCVREACRARGIEWK